MSTTYKFNGKLNFLGDTIKEYRLQNNLSLNDLATKLQLRGIELPFQALYSIECGERAIKDYELAGLTGILKLPIEKIFSDFFNNNMN